MIGKLGIVKFVLCGILFFGIGVVVLNIVSYNRGQLDSIFTNKNNVVDSLEPVITEIIDDFKSNTKPIQLTVKNSKIDFSNVSIRKFKIPSKNRKNKGILVRESGKGKYNILLLHERGSSSKIWEDTGTLQYLSNWGYRAFAVDIPNYDNNSISVKRDKEAIQWLTRVIHTLHLKNLVLMSSPMSDRLTLSYIFQLNEGQELIKGVVFIAPVETDKYNANDYKKIKIPTLIVHKEEDTKSQSAFDNLKQIPTSEILLIKNTSPSSFSEKLVEFHNGLRQFLYNIYRPIYQNHFKSFVSNTTKYKIKRIKKIEQ